MSDSTAKSQPAKSDSGSSGWIIVVVVVGVLGLLWFQSQRPPREGGAGGYVGQPLPPLHAAGWLNTAQPLSDKDLVGKVVLVDYWATWCGPCVKGIPEVVAFNERFRDSGVLVVGLTSESGPQAENVQRFVAAQPGMSWPIGYGAGMTMQMMGIQAIPTYMLYDRTGTCVWGGHSMQGAEAAAIKALAAQ